MINRLLNGFKMKYGLGDTTQVYTLPDGKQYTLTKAQIDAFNKVYNEAYGIAYSKLMSPPRVEDVLKYGEVVAEWYKQGIAFSEDKYNSQQSTGRSGSSTQSRQNAAEAVLPNNLPTVPPTEEEQGSGIFIPAILFAIGTIAAIAIAKSKPKKRR